MKRSVSNTDPYRLARSGSTSGNVDHPGSQNKIVINKEYIFFKEITRHMNNKLINDKKKHCFEYNIFYRKELRRKILEFLRFEVGSGSTIPGSGSADPDPLFPEVNPRIRINIKMT